MSQYKRWAISAAAIVVIAGVLLLLYARGFMFGTPTPEVEGMSVPQAHEALAEHGLQIGDVAYDEEAVAATGSIVTQTPGAGWRSDSGGEVDLVVAGSETLDMPDVTGMSEADGVAELVAEGLEVEFSEPVFSASFVSGLIATQTPSPGVETSRGAEVVLAASKGPDERVVPDVAGMAETEAKKQLESAGFTADVKSAQSGSVEKGLVISQSPETGSKLVAGEKVTISVSAGPELVTVPNARDFEPISGIDYYTVEQYRTIMGSIMEDSFADHGLKVDITWLSYGWWLDHSEEYNFEWREVISQSPKPGTKVPKGSTVKLTLLTGEGA